MEALVRSEGHGDMSGQTEVSEELDWHGDRRVQAGRSSLVPARKGAEEWFLSGRMLVRGAALVLSCKG